MYEVVNGAAHLHYSWVIKERWHMIWYMKMGKCNAKFAFLKMFWLSIECLPNIPLNSAIHHYFWMTQLWIWWQILLMHWVKQYMFMPYKFVQSFDVNLRFWFTNDIYTLLVEALAKDCCDDFMVTLSGFCIWIQSSYSFMSIFWMPKLLYILFAAWR